MRKYAVIPLFALSLLLASCGETGLSSSDSSSGVGSTSGSESISSSSTSSSSSASSSSSSSSSVEVEDPVTAKEAFKLLLDVAENDDYAIESTYEGVFARDVHRGSYFYQSLSNTGYALIDSYDKAIADKIVYLFYFDSTGAFRLGYPYVANGVLKTDLSDFDFFSPLENTLQVQNFFEEGDYAYTRNEKIIYALATGLGYGQDAIDKTFGQARFYLDGGDLAFSLQIYDPLKQEYAEVKDCQGVFRDVGSASIKEADDYLASFLAPSGEPLSEASISDLMPSETKCVSLVSTMEMVETGSGNKTFVAKTRSDRLIDEVRLYQEEAGGEKEEAVYFNDDGWTAVRGLDADNAVSSERLGEYYEWEDDYPTPYAVLASDLTAFHKEGDGYRYLGTRGDEMGEISFMGALSSPESVYVYLDENGLFDHLVVTYPEMTDGLLHYSVVITVELDPEGEFVDVVPATGLDSEDQEALERAFAYFDGSHSFAMLSHEERTEENQLNLYYDRERLVYEDISQRFSGTISTDYEGYYLDGGKSQRFIKPNGEDASRVDVALDEALSSHFRFDVSPLLFEKDDDGSYVIRDFVLTGVKDRMILGRNGSDIVISTLRLRLDAEGRIAEMSYDTDDGLTMEGHDVCTFLYDEDVVLPDGLIDELSSLPAWVEPTTWEEDSPDVYADFVAFYGEEDAATIPYLYHPETYRKWDSVYLYTVDISNSTKSGCDDEWYAAYKELLVENGYVLDLDPPYPGAQIYTKGHVTMRLAWILVGGIYFDIVE